jgi:Rnl2 family RNA ligase
MEFKKYSSLENSFRTKYMQNIVDQGLSGGTWVVTEKVHGANFSFLCDGNEVRVAKRTGLADEGFYNCGSVIEKYEHKVNRLFAHIKGNSEEEVDSIQVYGELAGGGAYPGIKSQVKSVQKGVHYSPELFFYAFDIRVNHPDKSVYVNYDEMVHLFQEFGFFYAKSLFKGTFQEGLEYSNEFPSTIPFSLGLPTEELGENVCEGVVIKPIEEKRFNSGERVAVKNKNEKWSEKSSKSRTPKVPVEIPEHIKGYVENISGYITENRLKNVLSKIGEVGQKDFGKVSGLFVKDAIEDFLKDNEGFKELEKSEQKMVTKNAGRLSAELIRPAFLDIIDGTY